MKLLAVIFLITSLSLPAWSQGAQLPTPSQQIASAVLPLPQAMRPGAGVLGYGPDLLLTTLRRSTNGMMCIATRPGLDQFDVRCYHESFLPIVRRARELYLQGKSEEDCPPHGGRGDQSEKTRSHLINRLWEGTASSRADLVQ
jgi:hypothetical protein